MVTPAAPEAVAAVTPKYCDYYGMLSYKDFLTHTMVGTLDEHGISARTDLTDD